jgi:hypothetical protein
MNILLEKYGCLDLSTYYNDEKQILQLKTNKTFRLIKYNDTNICYDSYGDFIIDDINNNLMLHFTDFEQEFHNNQKINIKQHLIFNINNNIILFDKIPNPFNFNFTNEIKFYFNI